MSMSTTRALLLAAGTSLALVACNTGNSQSGKSVYFGPGSAPNSNTFTGSGGLGGGVGAFTSVADLTTARASHTTTLLSDGRVLVVGGDGDDPQAKPFGMHHDAEVYDPVTAIWTVVSTLSPTVAQGRLMDPTGAFPTGRLWHTAVTLQNEVMICGGLGYDALVGGQPGTNNRAGPGALNNVYLFDPGSNTFRASTPMPVRRYFHLAHLLPNNKVLVTQGFDQRNQPGMSSRLSADVFDAGTGNWASVPLNASPPSQPNVNATVGGHTWGNIVQLDQDVMVSFGVMVDRLVAQGQQPIAMQVFGFAPGVYMPGTPGSNGSFPRNTTELYDNLTGQFNPGPDSLRSPPAAGAGQRTEGLMLGGAVTVSTGDVFFAGGENLGPLKDTRFAGATSQTEILEKNTRQFKAGPEMGSSFPPPAGATTYNPIFRTENLAVEAGNSADVVILGGVDPQGALILEVEVWSYLYNIMIGNLQMNQGRKNFGAVKLQSGQRILVVGGEDDANPPTKLSSVEIWER